MATVRITNRGKKLPQEKRFREKNPLEKDLEDKIAGNPDLFGEPLLMIGRHVVMKDFNGILDFLALDLKGNAVLIELKRSLPEESLEINALGYASYIAQWDLKDFEVQAVKFLGKIHDPDFNFNAFFKSFCEKGGIKKIPDINQDQRLIVAGSIISDDLRHFARWLKKHHIDITLVELQISKDEERFSIKTDFILPAAGNEVSQIKEAPPEQDTKEAKWRTWHLDKRCGPETKEMFLKLDQILKANFELDGPHWEQKSCINYCIDSSDWLCIITTPRILRLDFFVKEGSFHVDDIAKTLKIDILEDDHDENTSELIESTSSVSIKHHNEYMDQVQIRVKEDFDLESDRFLLFLEEAYRAFEFQ